MAMARFAALVASTNTHCATKIAQLAAAKPRLEFLADAR
jgi:hypothetical protein